MLGTVDELNIYITRIEFKIFIINKTKEQDRNRTDS